MADEKPKDKTEQYAEMVINAVQTYCEKEFERKFKKFADAMRFDERLQAFEHGGTSGEQMKSLERRASRHAEHLARLEDRVRALESGAAPAPLMLGDRSGDHVR